MTEAVTTIQVQPLCAEKFARFGDVIEVGDAGHFSVNQGSARRHHDLSRVQVDEQGQVGLSIFVADPVPMPVRVIEMEAHPLGSQAFIPMDLNRFLIVVAADQDGAPGEPEAFLAQGGQGVNYHRGVWHHPLLALDAPGRFLVVDRVADGSSGEENLVVAAYAPPAYSVATLVY